MKLASQTRASMGSGMVVARQVAGVGLFVDHDARVGAELPGELAVADIDGMDVGGAVGEQDVGEASGGGADVQADAIFR